MAGPSDLDFYLARVVEAQAEAQSATLSCVRERCERSLAAWTSLAERAQRHIELREKEMERKAEAGLTS